MSFNVIKPSAFCQTLSKEAEFCGGIQDKASPASIDDSDEEKDEFATLGHSDV